MQVLSDVFSEHGGALLKADGDFEALEALSLKLFGGRAVRETAAASEGPAPAPGESELPLWVQLPWLLQEENWGLITDDSDTKSNKKTSSSGSRGPGHAEDIDLWEMDADDVWEELRAQRENRR